MRPLFCQQRANALCAPVECPATIRMDASDNQDGCRRGSAEGQV
jgi:hypothetical protein